MAKGLLIQTDGSTSEFEVNSYLDWAVACGGNVDWTSTDDGLWLYCYEYALYENVVNPVVTQWYWEHDNAARRRKWYMCGPVLLQGQIDPATEDSSDLDPKHVAEIEQIRNMLGEERIRNLARKLEPHEIPQPEFVRIPKGDKTSGEPEQLRDIIERMFGNVQHTIIVNPPEGPDDDIA